MGPTVTVWFKTYLSGAKHDCLVQYFNCLVLKGNKILLSLGQIMMQTILVPNLKKKI